MKTIGKILFGKDNDSYMHPNKSNQEICCSYCGNRTKMILNEQFELNEKGLDVSYTYDGYPIVSLRFKKWLDMRFGQDLKFSQIKNDSNYFWLEIKPVIKFDSERRNTKMIEQCNHCRNYKEVVGATPGFVLEPEKLLNGGIFRSDIKFGSVRNQFCLMILDLNTASDISLEKFIGLSFAKIIE